MANVEAALYYTLSTTSGVTALVRTRVYPAMMPQDAAYPAVVYQRISTVHVDSLDGIDGLVDARFQVTCLATTYDTARALANAVRAALNGAHGTWASVVVQVITLEDERDILEESPGAEEERLFGISQDYIVWYEE